MLSKKLSCQTCSLSMLKCFILCNIVPEMSYDAPDTDIKNKVSLYCAFCMTETFYFLSDISEVANFMTSLLSIII